MHRYWFASVAGCGCMLVLLAGCERDEIETYAVVPKEPVPPAEIVAPVQEATKPALTYAAPDGWQELPVSGMRIAAFAVTENDQQAQITVITLRGQAGGALANVNRWRGQVNLSGIDQAQLAGEMQSIEIDGLAAHYVDLIGPESDDGQQLRIVCAFVERSGTSWFMKMTGPADLVGRQKSAFEAFIGSIRFDGAGAGTS